MPSLLYLVVPFVLSRYFEVSETLGPVYPLTICLAVGMWLVVYRYQTVRDRPFPFQLQPPPAADPAWSSVVIPNPSIKSHETNPELVGAFLPRERKLITCYDPATGHHLNTVVADNERDIQDKIARASVAQRRWKHTTFAQRRKVIRSLQKWLVDNQQACARVACRDTGKTVLDAALGEILVTCSKAQWISDHGEDALKPQARHSNLMLSYKSSEVHYDPLGVVAAIVSWNYPLHNAWSPIMAALFSGNAIVLKCSEQVIWSSSWFVGAVRECLRVCGYDPELVQIVCCYPEEAWVLTRSPMIKHITFIGSERVGKIIARDATEHLTPVTLELGGKDPCIILKDTDLNKYMSTWMRGVFQNAGQNCIGIERLIVHTSQYNELYRMFVERTSRLRTGAVMAQSPEGHIPIVDMGAMINGDRFNELRRLIASAAAPEDGASVEVGGEPYRHAYHDHGTYFQPTVVGDADPDSEIAQTELFAPVALILIYEDVEEAIDIANSTRYGLGASVFGPHEDECLKVAKRLECGMVAINDFAVYYMNQDLPFGGVKASGYGRFGGPEGLRSLTNPKAIIVDRWPWLVQTTIPKVVDYPVRSLINSWDFVSGLTAALYAESYRDRFDGLVQLINAARR